MVQREETTRNRILVLADDLTGALEAGAKFAAQGIASRVVVAEGREPPVVPREISVLVLDTETRHVSPDEAASRVCKLAREMMADGFSIIYKKTDSTLRGNIGSELRGLWEACPDSGLLYVPAYPKMGRTVKQGVLHVDGRPVSATDFGSDALNSVSESSIPKLLAPFIPLPIVSVDAEDLLQAKRNALYVCDADSDEEVEKSARYFIESEVFRLAAGPSAFLHYLAKLARLPRHQPARLPHVRRALIVNGSRNRRSLDQIRYAKENGFPSADSADSLNPTDDPGWWVLDNGPQAAKSSVEVAACVAKKVVGILNQTEIDGLVVFGGDTAHAVLRALGQSVIHPVGEALEGVPVSRIRLQRVSEGVARSERNIVLATKAGGFGPTNVLPMIRSVLA